MLNRKFSKIISIILVLCFLFPTVALAAPGNIQQVKYIYFQDSSYGMVIVDYDKAIQDALNGNTVLYLSIRSYLGTAVGNGAPIILETTIGTVLDYQKALIDNKSNLLQIQDDIAYQTTRPAYANELRVLNGTALIVPIIVPAAPAVTKDDTANTVGGMMVGYEYSLNSDSYVLYNAATFASINFSGNHTLLVRVAAAGTVPAGDVTTLTFTTNPVTPPAPAVTNDDTANTVSGMLAGMEYSLDGKSYVAYNTATFASLNFSGSHILLIRIAAAGVNPASPDTTLTFTSSVNENAEATVSAYESAPISTLVQITAAEGLKAPADSAAAAVTDAAMKAAFEARIASKAGQIATAKADLTGNETAAQAAAETAIATLEAAPLTNIMQINTAAGYKTTADTRVSLVGDATAKAAFQSRITAKFIAMAIAELSLQTSTSSYDTYMNKYLSVIGINFTEYNTLANKLPVQNAMVAATFTSISEIQTTFNTAVAAAKAAEASYITAFNSAADTAAIGTAITTYATQLSLTLTEYNALANKTPVQTALLGRSFATGEQIKTAFLIAVINNTTSAGLSTLMSTNAVFLGLATTSEYSGTAKSSIEAGIMTARPIADKTHLIVVAISSNTLSGYFGLMLPYFKDTMGLDLTDYNALTNRDRLNVQADITAATMATITDVQNAFNASVLAKKANEVTALAAFNNATTATEIGTAITASVTTYLVSYDVTDYAGLSNKTPVQNYLLIQTFTSMTQVEAAISAASGSQKNLEATAMTNINNAITAPEMETAILNNASTLGLNLTDYNSLSATDKIPVHNTMLAQTFYSVTVLKTTYDSAIASQKAVVAVNNADAATMGALITANFTVLGLTVTDYNTLQAADKDTVHTALIGKAFADKAAVKAAFDAAVAIPLFNMITTTTAMSTAINTYASVLGISLTNYNSLAAINKTAVQTAMLTPVFLTASDIKASFDAAVTNEKVNVAISAINSTPTAAFMATNITSYAVTLGLDLTEYNTLTNKVPVQTALLTPVFVTAADVKTAFDTAVAVEKVNEAAVTGMGAILTSNAVKLGLDLTDYNALIYKEPVHNAMVSPVFADTAAVKGAFDTAVAQEKAIEAPLLDTPAVRLNKPATNLIIGTSETLIATVLPANAPNTNVTWSSANSAVATVNNSGVVTAVGAGTVNITVITVDGGYTDTCAVTVTVPVNGVTLNKTVTSVYIGTTDTLIATVLPANASNKDLIWTTSGAAYATVNNGVVTGVALNVATITVTTVDGSYKATCQVTVTNLAAVLNNMNLATPTYMPDFIIKYANVLGLDLTDYQLLGTTEKTQVQDALMAPTFTTAEQIKAVYDEAIAVQMINTSTVDTIGNTLIKYATVLGLDLTAYNQLTDKSYVHTYLTTWDYGAAADIKFDFDTAVADTQGIVTALAQINAATADTMGTALVNNAVVLGLDLTDYNLLTDNTSVHTYLDSQTYTSADVLRNDFYTAVFDAGYIESVNAALAQINAATADTMGTALVNNAFVLGLDLTDYNLLTDNTSVHTYLDSQTYTSADVLRIDFDMAVAQAGSIAKVNAPLAVINAAPVDIMGATLVNSTNVSDGALQPSSNTDISQDQAIEAALAEINASTVDTIGTVLVNNAITLGLDLTAYDQLIDKTSVHTYLDSRTYTTADVLRIDFNTAVAEEQSNENANAALAQINIAPADAVGTAPINSTNVSNGADTAAPEEQSIQDTNTTLQENNTIAADAVGTAPANSTNVSNGADTAAPEEQSIQDTNTTLQENNTVAADTEGTAPANSTNVCDGVSTAVAEEQSIQDTNTTLQQNNTVAADTEGTAPVNNTNGSDGLHSNR